MKRSIRFPSPHSARIAALAVYLYLVSPKLVAAEDNISFKWQDYSEDNDRIRVLSKYLGFHKEINSQFAVRGHAVHDSISGATPTGEPAEDGEDVPLGELIEIRDAGVINLDWKYGIHQSSFEYSYSSEPDFLSRGYAFTQTSEFNKRNTGLTYGISRIEDDVRPTFFDQAREKSSHDYIVGVSQVVDPNTIVALNFTYSDYSGYLSDPYKIIRKDTEVLPNIFFPLNFVENRPDERTRRIWFFNVKRYFDKIGGSIDFDYRYFNDTWGVESHTFDFEWYQKIGDKIIVRPKYRYYNQNAASFYTLDLNGSSFDPEETIQGQAPHYSADYRLAKFETRSYGLKVIYKITERYSLDAAYERYDMNSKDDTPQSAFADADIVTIGGAFWF